MKKLLLSLVALLATLGALAQSLTPVLTYTNITAPQELSVEDANTIRGLSAMTIVAEVSITNSSNMSLLFAAVADVTSNSTSNNAMWGVGVGGNSMRYVVGPRTGGWYSSTDGDISTSTKKVAFTYNGTTIGCHNDKGNSRNQTSTKALNTFNGNNAKFYLGGMIFDTDSKWGSFNGKILSVRIYNSVLTAEQIANLPNCFVKGIDEFKNGQIYTFVTERGWLGAKTDNDNLISTAHSSNSALQPSKDNADFLWTVYKSENNRYYLYNLGKKKFVGNQDNNNQAIPFVAEPTTKKLTFKNSSSGEYPIMFSTNKTGVVNHSSAQAHSCGIVNWKSDAEGWNKLNDTGSNHKIEDVGDLDAETLALIQAAVATIEADNTEEVATLKAIITKTENYYNSLPIGAGIGKYSSTNENYANDFAAIKTFYEGITTKTEPTIDVLDAKIAEMEALYASIQLNMPEAGKFYRIENESKTGYLACGTGTGLTQFTAGISEKANSIFYYTGSKLVCYTTGLYLAESGNFLHYTNTVGEAAGTTIGFSSTPVVGMYAISFKNGDRSFYSSDAGDTNAASSGQTGQHYRFNLHEVEWLPIAINEEVKHATFYSPVDLNLSFDRFKAYTVSANAESATLIEQTYVPANTGVVLVLQNGAEVQDGYCYLQVKGTKEAVESELQGTFDTQYIDVESYVLSNGSEGLGFYKALMNQSNNSAFKNNAFKAYLPATAATANARFLNFNFGDDTETAIESVEGENAEVKTEIFDLAGRRVQNAQKGIYIVNGKVVIK